MRQKINFKQINEETSLPVPFGWIQWKGTNVCIDLHCECGELGHVDDDFLYEWTCDKCSRRYAIGAQVKLVPLDFEGNKK